MDMSKMMGKDLQDIYKAGLARRVPKDVLSDDVDKDTGLPIEVQQDIPVFIGEPGYEDAVADDAPLWEPLRLVHSQPRKHSVTTGNNTSGGKAA
jgi:hypothetical protein